MTLINKEALIKIAPSVPAKIAEIICAYFNNICPKYGINTRDIFEEFITTCAHESQEFTKLEENMNYSEDRLKVVFSYFRKNPVAAKTYARKPEFIANIVYADKNRGSNYKLGNTKLGDGWLFRGSGPIMITGRDMVESYTRYYNANNSTNISAEVMASNIRMSWEQAIDSACWVFAIEKKLIPYAVNDNFKYISERIAGTGIGMESRNKYYERAKKYLPQ